MMKEALRSLRNSPANALFFAMTFFLTTALLFSYFHMAAAVSDGMPEVYYDMNHLADLFQMLEKGNAGNLMMVFIVIMCAVDLVFANDFFVKNKAREIGVRLMCGATYIQLAAYLLIQTAVLMAVTIPLGIAAGYSLVVWMRSLLDITIPLDGYAWMEFISVMVMIVFWTTALNCSFAYKSGAVLLAGGNMNALMRKEMPYGLRKTRFMEAVYDVVGVIAALFPLVQFYYGGIGLAVGMVIGCVGLDRVLVHIVVPLLTRHNRKRGTRSTASVLRSGFLRRDILFSKFTVYLFLTDILVLLAMMTRDNSPLEASLVRISYVCICILQAMTILFRLATDISTRHTQYRILDRIGTDETIRKAVPVQETVLYGLFLLLVVLFYGGVASVFILQAGSLQVKDIIFSAVTAVVPAMLCLAILCVYNRRETGNEAVRIGL